MIAALLISAGLCYYLSLPFASVLQGGNYRARAILRAKKELVLCGVFFLIVSIGVVFFSLLAPSIFKGVLSLICYLLTGAFIFVVHRKMKMPLIFTNRLVRLLVLATGLYGVIVFPLCFTKFWSLWSITPILSPLILVAAMIVIAPFEKRNNAKYVRRAKEKLDSMSAIKIAITGSYGKTSVKANLDLLFSAKHKTLVSPANYNTPLGFAKTMECASGKEEYVILEMGARRKGDIREMCEIVHPTIGVITGIAPQHLETFGSIGNILEEKGELSRSVAKENPVFFNLTDPEVRKLYNERQGSKIGVGFKDADYLIENLDITEKGSSFILTHGEKEIFFTIPGVGVAFVVNFSLAAVVALELGLSEEQVAEGAERAYPAPHRFEVVSRGAVTIIDDSYNVNPVGAQSALTSLGFFSGRRKIVYTSGIVELGSAEIEYNKALGKEIAQSVTIAIVCEGKYGDLVVDGIRESRSEMPIIRVKDTREASTLFASLLKEGDVLLIMSDLPRDYLL